jgi:acyl carrier protein
METKTEAQSMIEFINSTILRGSDLVSEETPLVSSGVLDSFSLIEVLQQLERVTKRRIRPTDVTPNDLETVAAMLRTAERVGRKL